MLRKIWIILLITAISLTANAQLYNSYKRLGEIGLGVGVGHYFGDLNPSAALNRPKISAGIFFIKNFNDYIGLKANVNYSLLGYSDQYSKNYDQRIRNLSFNSNIWEFSLSGYFNFFKYLPGVDGYNYTPYVSLGVGVFSYDPYAFLDGQKYFLRPLGTEGQGSPAYPDRKPYSSTALCVPLTVGFKIAVRESINLYVEAGYRFTNTDYLDDVSTTYAGAENFPPLPNGQPSPAYLLQDRSYVTINPPIGIKGRQRGNSQQKDAYALLQVGVSFNLTSYKCPTANTK
ncbi:MAG: outer membrane beta-barrel protein [Bacteroidetes bacterium]|nr:outer membrane beta-barrel protein [Bacteroidota bacterium]